MNVPAIPLTMLHSGEQARIVSVDGDDQWARRMAELGILADRQIQMMQPGNPCLVVVGESRVSLRGDDVSRILVAPI